MTSPFDASNQKKRFTWWKLLFVSLLFIVFLLVLFPAQLFMKSVIEYQTPNEVSISYLKNLIKINPKDLKIKLTLAQQEIALGQVEEAEALIKPMVIFTPSSYIQWEILWVYYEILRIKTFALKENNARRAPMEKLIINLLPVFVKSPVLTGKQAALIAQDALAFNLVQLATSYYKIAIEDKKIILSSRFFAQAAQAMLYVKDYQRSADYYIFAMQRSPQFSYKRKYYIKAVNSLAASGFALKALNFAQKNIDILRSDKDTLLYLADLALQANQQKAATQYISAVLQLRYRE